MCIGGTESSGYTSFSVFGFREGRRLETVRAGVGVDRRGHTVPAPNADEI